MATISAPPSLRAVTRIGSNGARPRKRGMFITSNIFLILLLGMVVAVVFFCGLYVGSAFMQEHNNLDSRSTFHIISASHKSLRGASLNPMAVLEGMWDSNLRHTPPEAKHPDGAAPGPITKEAVEGRQAEEKVAKLVKADEDNVEGDNDTFEMFDKDDRAIVPKHVEPPPAPQEKRVPPAAKQDAAASQAKGEDPVVKMEPEEDKTKAKPKPAVKKVDSKAKASPAMGLPNSKPGMKVLAANGQRSATLTSSMDELALTISGWIYLDRKIATSTMNTILSNKLSGCESGVDRMGYALYVNTWQTEDRQLILEWGNEFNGCAKLGSGQSGAVLEYDTWTHIAAVMSSSSVSLYINGKKVAHSSPIERKHQHNRPLTIGRYSDGDYSFFGKVSSLAFFREALDGTTIQALQEKPLSDPLYSASNVMAAIPLDDAPIKGKGDLAVHDLKGNVVGQYEVAFDTTVSMEALLDGVPEEAKGEVTEQMRKESDKVARQRREAVKGAMKRAWKAYKAHAFGSDELKPVSLTGHDNWGGIGCTLVDSLDTLWLMGLKEEFWDARDWVRDKLTFQRTYTVSVFETTIRELGGLLAAYDLSGDKAFLDKAQDLGDRLLGAFNTPSGIPNGQVNLQTKASNNVGWTGGSAILSELGTLQLEFRYLSHATGNPIYAEKANKVFDVLAQKEPSNGLYPIYINTRDGSFANSQITFGALGDSFYEYLLKVWLQGGRKEATYRRMFDNSMDGMMKTLLKKSSPSGLLYVADLDGGRIVDKMDHLVCFLPAVLALGAVTLPEEDSDRADKYMNAAKGLTYTCYQMYHRYPTHLAPEFVRFVKDQDMVPGANFYILRPETAEALFYLHELTGNPIYRDWAWEIFQGIDKYCRTNEAYGAHPDVTSTGRVPDDRMESFFLAETLKYLYLIQDPDHTLDIKNKHVFNTEAHPLTNFDVE